MRSHAVGCPILLQEGACQHQNIVSPLAKGRQLQHHHGQAVVQVGSEAPRQDLTVQLHLSRGNQFHIQRVLDHRPHPPHPFGLDRGQALALERQGQGGDLIQEQGAPRRRLKEAGLDVLGIGKGPGLDAKQLGFQQRVRDGRTIHLDERALGAWATVVHDPGHEPLAGASFPLQQDSGDRGMPHGVEAGQVPDLGAQGLQGRSLAEETVQGVGRGQRASTSHAHLRGEVWPGDREWLRSVADIG